MNLPHAPRITSLLVVDDNPVDRALYQALLHEEHAQGYNFIEHATAADALATLGHLVPDCVLLDYYLPDMTGIDFLRTLRGKHPGLPVIMLTGQNDSRISAESIKLGADDYLEKDSITGPSLARAIRNAIEKRTLEKQLGHERQRLDVFFNLFDQSSDLLFVVDVDTCLITETNKATETMLGAPKGDLVGTNFCHQPLFRAAATDWEALLTERSNGHERRFECDLRRPDGSSGDVEVRAKVVHLADGNFMVAVARDITERKALEEHLRRITEIDGLTNIFNRRSFEDRLVQEWRRVLRHPAPIALLMMDVDHFKIYNDRHGHLAGDECLRKVAQNLAKATRRAGEFVARYGGEEFSALLPGTDEEGALSFAQSLMDELRALQLPHPGSPVAPFVTLSIGIAVLTPQPGLAPALLVEQADQALYQAKAQGRNRIVVYRAS